MVAEAEFVCRPSIVPVLDAQYRCDLQEIEFDPVRPSESGSTDLSGSQPDLKSPDKIPGPLFGPAILQYAPSVRSGSFADIGRRKYMEDEHIRIDDLSTHMGSLFRFPKPCAFYGVFDGHGGPEAAAYVKKNVIRLCFEDVEFPRTSEVDNMFLEEVQNSLQKTFLLADQALADDCSVSSSSGTTALTVLIFGRLLMVANAGDCRAVLCRKGESVDLSRDHRPVYPSEQKRVEELGGYIDDGYLNGILSVSRALGDWDMKFPHGSASPLIADPEFHQVFLTEDDEFLIIGCDGVWDVMSSQHAVSLVRHGLRRHDDPGQCARDLAMEALRLNTSDNLTVIVVCLSSIEHGEPSPPRRRRCCSLSPEALCSLRRLLDGNATP